MAEKNLRDEVLVTLVNASVRTGGLLIDTMRQSHSTDNPWVVVIPRNAFTADEEVLERNEDLMDDVTETLLGHGFPVLRALGVYVTGFPEEKNA